ncbi:MAG: diacylglycerol kinase family protein [Patescibacteria group bacterium]
MNFLKSFGFAMEGLAEMILNHKNFRLQFVIGAVAVIAGIFFGLNYFEWMALVLASGLVLIAEMANSSVEAVVDLITSERRLQAKKAKDIAAGMVLLASCLSIVIGILIFGPRLKRFL